MNWFVIIFKVRLSRKDNKYLIPDCSESVKEVLKYLYLEAETKTVVIALELNRHFVV
jgi:hypothetical protein